MTKTLKTLSNSTFPGCLAANFSILNPDGSTLASSYICGANGSLNNATLPNTGTYTVVIAPQSGGTGSAIVTLLFAQSAASHIFTPVAGTYTTTQSVTISNTTAGTAIYYTTDGTKPTITSAQFSSVIPVSANETTQAIAIVLGSQNSSASSASYAIVASPALLGFSLMSVVAGTTITFYGSHFWRDTGE